METLFNVDIENLTEEERETFLKLVGKSHHSKVWKPKRGEHYFTVSNLNKEKKVIEFMWDDDDSDNFYYELGKVFHTEEEAKEDYICQKMLTRWKQMSIAAGEADNPWDNKALHYSPYYNLEANTLSVTYVRVARGSDIYFPTEKSIKNAINKLGEDNVKKYILNIK